MKKYEELKHNMNKYIELKHNTNNIYIELNWTTERLRRFSTAWYQLDTTRLDSTQLAFFAFPPRKTWYLVPEVAAFSSTASL